ncbi:MAG: hypothetical protein Fur005_02340 [Roseiflexaceae bacterium]
MLLLVCCGPSQAQIDATATAYVAARDATATAELATATATAQSAVATATTLQEAATNVLEVTAIELTHSPQNKLVPTYDTGVDTRDFIIEATFLVPYQADSEAGWDVGFLLRSTGDDEQLRLIIASDGSWYLVRSADGDPPIFEDISAGPIADLPTQADQPIEIRLVALGDQGQLFINQRYITTLDLSAKLDRGMIVAATGLFLGNERKGAATRIERLTIWEIER